MPKQDWFRDKDDLLTISTALVVGVAVAASVFTFDVSIQYIHDLPDILSKDYGIGGGRATGFQLGDFAIPFRCIMPVGAGVAVAALQAKGFSPPLKFLTRAIEGVVDDRKSYGVPTSYGPVGAHGSMFAWKSASCMRGCWVGTWEGKPGPGQWWAHPGPTPGWSAWVGCPLRGFPRGCAPSGLFVGMPCLHLPHMSACLHPLRLHQQVFRKAAASAITLGSGASLGPEAPSVELGANTAAVLAPKHLSKRRQRMLVAAGAAAGGCAAG